jgi:hypothetical protein
MAFSSTKVKDDIFGTTRVQIWTWSAASVTTGTISTGFTKVLHISPNNEVTEDIGKWVPTNGNVVVSGVTSNDKGTVIIYGQ